MHACWIDKVYKRAAASHIVIAILPKIGFSANGQEKMKVVVRYNVSFAETTGRRAEEFEIEPGMNLEDLLRKIAGKYGEKMDLFEQGTNNLKPHFWVFINGHSITHLQGLATKLKDRDQILLTLPVGGG